MIDVAVDENNSLYALDVYGNVVSMEIPERIHLRSARMSSEHNYAASNAIKIG